MIELLPGEFEFPIGEGEFEIEFLPEVTETATDLYGTQCNDELYGTWEDDSIHGYEGNDKLYGDYGNDTLKGGDGNDYLYGDQGEYVLYIGWLEPPPGEDKLEGGDGNDYLDGGYGDNVLKGGNGADTFALDVLDFMGSQGIDEIKDFSSHEGDVIEVDSSSLGISTSDLHRFSFDNQTGALSFDGKQFATLQPNSGFDLCNDLSIVQNDFSLLQSLSFESNEGW